MPHLSRKEVERRIKNHEALPDSVLVDFPDIAKKYNIVPAKPNPRTALPKMIAREIARLRKEHPEATAGQLKAWAKFGLKGRKKLGREMNPRAKRRNKFIEIDPNEYRNYINEVVAKKENFDPRSFRYKKLPNGNLLLVGCPKGHFNAISDRCRVGTRAQHILKPKHPSAKNPKESFFVEYRDGKQTSRVFGFESYQDAKKYADSLTKQSKKIEITAIGKGKMPKRNPGHSSSRSASRRKSKIRETLTKFKRRMHKEHPGASDAQIDAWYRFRNKGIKALGLDR